MGNIVLLDDLTINKIAAGEVIERPASVVKEMIENSIDAGATNINVEIKNGGISYIRISDNGKGIEQDDLELAFERHATSKLRRAEDLNDIKSMGFRGEALASIVSISNVEMITRTANNEVGYKIIAEAGKILSVEEIGCPVGTTITVTNLFFNTPVRYKFLKKDYTESGYIEDVVTRTALVNTDIAFKLISSGKSVLQTSGNGSLQDVVYAIYGKDVASNILDVNYNYEDIKILGVVGKPEIARSNRGNQLFFVNKRHIKDKILSGALEKAFKGMLPIGKYGFCVLNLDLNPNKVDVNVHPAKLEVRFEEENKVFKALYHAVQGTLLKAELITNTEKEISDEEIKEGINKKTTFSDLFKRISDDYKKEAESKNNIEEIYNERKQLNENEEQVDTETKSTVLDNLLNIQNQIYKHLEENPNTDVDKEKLEQEKLKIQSMLEKNDIIEDKEESKNVEDITQNIEETSEEKDTENIKMGELLTEIVRMKAELENDDSTKDISEETQKFEINKLVNELDNLGLNQDFNAMYEKTFGKSLQEDSKEDLEIKAYDIIKDNNLSVFEDSEEYKVSNSKINYKFVGIAFSTYIILEIENELYIMDQHAAHERIMYEKVKKNYYSYNEKDSQLLLLPDIITLTHKEMDIARDNIDIFKKAGFELEEFGENTIKLTGVPTICFDLDTKELFLETLDEINTVARTAKQEIEEKFIATVACKAAVKANMALSKEEVDSLMDQLLLLPNPFTCPHGRPTVIKMEKSDIEKKFARRK